MNREKRCSLAECVAERVVVENNTLGLPAGLMNYGQAVASWTQYAQDNNLTPEQTQSGMNKLAQGDLPEGANIPKVTGGALIGAIANGSYQWIDLGKPGNENKGWDYWGSASAGITGALAPGRNIWQNAGIAAGGTLFTDGPDKGALTGAGAGWAVGSVVDVVAPSVFAPVLGPGSGFVSDVIGSVGGEFIGNKVKDKINKKDSNDAEK